MQPPETEATPPNRITKISDLVPGKRYRLHIHGFDENHEISEVRTEEFYLDKPWDKSVNERRFLYIRKPATDGRDGLYGSYLLSDLGTEIYKAFVKDKHQEKVLRTHRSQMVKAEDPDEAFLSIESIRNPGRPRQWQPHVRNWVEQIPEETVQPAQ